MTKKYHYGHIEHHQPAGGENETQARQQEINAGVEPPDDEALSVPRPDSRSLTTYSRYDSIIKSVAQ